MIRDFVHLIQNKLRHYAVFPSLHSLSRSSAFQTALFLLGVLAFALGFTVMMALDVGLG